MQISCDVFYRRADNISTLPSLKYHLMSVAVVPGFFFCMNVIPCALLILNTDWYERLCVCVCTHLCVCVCAGGGEACSVSVYS